MDSMDSPRLRQNVPLTSQQVSADPSNTMIDINDYASLQNTFKVSHLVRPKHYQTLSDLLAPSQLAEAQEHSSPALQGCL